MSKTRDRAALQLEALHEGWQRERDGTAAAARLAHVWGCPLPARNALLLETARAYMRIGAVSTAAGMFERLGRVREHMSCLVVAGKPHAAGQLCEDLLASGETARHQRWELLCLLGELREQEALWRQAWQESEGRCAMAMRMLGRAQQRRGQLEEAAASLGLALAVAPAFPETQFARGCALLALARFAEAAACFAAAVHGLPDDGQAWANLAVALEAAQRPEQALVAAEQAARLLPRDWRVQLNCALLALRAARPQLAVHALRALVALRPDERHGDFSLGPLLAALAQLCGSGGGLDDADNSSSSAVATSGTKHLGALLDEACQTWPDQPALYALRSESAAAHGDGRAALLDAARAARLLKSRLQQDPHDQTRLDRLVRALQRQQQLLAAFPALEDVQDHAASLREAVAQLVNVYGDQVKDKLGVV